MPKGRDCFRVKLMIELAQIAPAFSYIADKGFVSSASGYHPERFGNADLLMVGAPFSLRFLRDRGEVFVDAGSTAGGWHKLENVLEFVDPSITEQQLGSPPDPERMAQLLQEKWDDVVNVFLNQERISELRALGKQKSAALMRQRFRRLS